MLNQESLTKDEAISIFENAEITFDLLNETYTVRKHYYGKKVKLNMILNAKVVSVQKIVGTWAICKMKEKQRYALVEQDQIKEGTQVATENQPVHTVSL